MCRRSDDTVYKPISWKVFEKEDDDNARSDYSLQNYNNYELIQMFSCRRKFLHLL